MKKIIIQVTFEPEFGFKNYMDFCINEDDVKNEIIIKREYKTGDYIEIACIDCKILDSLGNSTFNVEVLSNVIRKLPLCLHDMVYMYSEEAEKLADNISDRSSKEECDFYYKKESFFRKILNDYIKTYKLQKCDCCTDYIELEGEFCKSESDDKKFCSRDCSEVYVQSKQPL